MPEEQTFTIEEDLKKSSFSRGVLEALLYKASLGGVLIPTVNKFVLTEIANGTIEYITGKPGTLEYQRNMDDKYEDGEYGVERRIWQHYREKIHKSRQRELHLNINAAINRLLDPSVADFDTIFKCYSGICQVFSESTFSFPQRLIRDVTQKLKLFSSAEMRDINGISGMMTKYIEEDVNFIKRTYRW